MILKAILMNAAAQLAAGVASNLPDELSVDPEVSNPKTQAENLMAFRLCHIFFDGLVRALDPRTGWQTPELPAAIDLPALADGSPVAKLLSDLIAAIPRPTGPTLPPLPVTPSPK